MTTERKLEDFHEGQGVFINEYLGFVDVPATVVFVGRTRTNSPPTVDVRLEKDAGHPSGTVLHFLENELDKLEIEYLEDDYCPACEANAAEPRFEDKSE